MGAASAAAVMTGEESADGGDQAVTEERHLYQEAGTPKCGVPAVFKWPG